MASTPFRAFCGRFSRCTFFGTRSAFLSWFFTIAVLLSGRISASAFLASDVNVITSAYTNRFYTVSGTNGYFKATQTGGVTDFWRMANEIECVIDAYEWTSNATYQAMITNLLNGFMQSQTANWMGNPFNDDVMWAVMAFARGGAVTGRTNYCNVAKSNFDACYARGFDSVLGGGLYWNTSNQSKNACVNGPGAIAAYLLYQIYSDTNYFNKATNLYAWERSVLYNTGTGRIYDNINISGTVDQTPTTYNQGTFIGAADFLAQTNDAMLAANYTMNSMGSVGYMPQYGIGGNNSIFNAIFIRWMARFMKNRGLQDTYENWLQGNANAAWNGRRASDNLSWCQWPQPTPEGTNFNSFDCISSFEAMLAVPPTQTTNPTVVTLNVSDASGSSFESGLNWSDATAPSSDHDYLVNGLTLRTPVDALNHYFAGSSLTLSNGAVLACKNTSGGKGIQVGTDLFLDNGEVADWANTSTEFSGKATLRSGGGRIDPQSNTFTVSALIGGTGALHIKGTDLAHLNGTVILSGANTYSGGTFIDAAHTVRLNSFGSFGSISNSLTFTNGTGALYGTVDLNALNLQVGGLGGGGGKILNNGGATGTFTVGNSNATGGVYKGFIADGTAAIALVKTGSGTNTLANNINRVGGGLTVSGGSLVVSNASLSVGTATNSLSIAVVNSGNSTGTLDLSSATNFSANVDNLKVGVTTAASGSPTIIGALLLGTSNTITASIAVVIGDMGNSFNTSVQSVTTPAGGATTIITPGMTLGGSKASATFALGNGAKLNLGNGANRMALSIAVSPQAGSGSYTGNLDASAGIFNGVLGSITLGSLANGSAGNETGNMSVSANAANHLDVSGGANAVTIGRFVSGTGVGKANGTLTIGNLDATSVIASTNNGTAVLIGATANSVGTLNLNGGTLKITTTGAGIAGGSGTSTLNLNGVTLKAGASSPGFITNLTSASVNAVGVTFDTAEFNITVAEPLLDGGGGVTKIGAGKLTLSQVNSYTGNTIVNAGTLALSEPGSIGASVNITVASGATLDSSGRSDQTLTLNNGQTLAGGGVINGKLSALSGSTITPGNGIGTLAVQGDVGLSGKLLLELNRTNSQTSDQLNVGGSIVGGGTLTVTNLGPDLQVGDAFQLFNKAAGGFSSVGLPPLNSNLTWTNKLGIDGTIQVVSVVSTTPPTLGMQQSGTGLNLSWPADHIGWRLQAQTNGLGTNWVDVTDSAVTNSMIIPIDPANGSVFFRLVSP